MRPPHGVYMAEPGHGKITKPPTEKCRERERERKAVSVSPGDGIERSVCNVGGACRSVVGGWRRRLRFNASGDVQLLLSLLLTVDTLDTAGHERRGIDLDGRDRFDLRLAVLPRSRSKCVSERFKLPSIFHLLFTDMWGPSTVHVAALQSLF